MSRRRTLTQGCASTKSRRSKTPTNNHQRLPSATTSTTKEVSSPSIDSSFPSLQRAPSSINFSGHSSFPFLRATSPSNQPETIEVTNNNRSMNNLPTTTTSQASQSPQQGNEICQSQLPVMSGKQITTQHNYQKAIFSQPHGLVYLGFFRFPKSNRLMMKLPRHEVGMYAFPWARGHSTILPSLVFSICVR